MTAQAPLPPATHCITHRRPPTGWWHGLPLGNGRVGAMVWGDGAPLSLTLDHTDLWDLRLDGSFLENPQYTYAELRRLVAEGRFDEAQEISGTRQRRDNPLTPIKIGIGRAEIDLGAAEEYCASLNLDRALVEGTISTAGATYSVQAFVHCERPLVCLHLGQAPAQARLRLVPLAQTGPELAELDHPEPSICQDGDLRVLRQQIPAGHSYAVVWNTRGPDFYIAIETAADLDAAEAQARETWRQASCRGFAALLAEHADAWAGFWQTSSVWLPEEHLELLWYYGIYLLAASSHRGSTPPGLQGVWAMDGQRAPWAGDYHADMNVQETFWPACASGHLDLLDTWCDYMKDCLDPALAFTRRFFGSDGTFWPCSTAPGFAFVGCWGTVQFGWSHTGWLGWLVWLRWRYSMDVEWLAQTGYPVLAELFRFYRANLEEGDDGYLHVPLSSSPEYRGNDPEAWCRDPNVDLALIRRCCDWLLEMEDALGVEELGSEARRIRQTLVPYDLTPDRALTLWPGQPLDESHRHPSQLMAIHPAMDLTIDGDEDERAIIEASIEQFQSLGQYHWAGHTYAQLISMAAVLGRSGWAYDSLRQFADHWIAPNGLHFNRVLSGAGTSSFRLNSSGHTTAPFTMESNCAVSAGISDMLVQGWNDIVRVFPAVPDTWRDVAFRDLVTEGAFRVSAVRRHGRTVWVRVTADVARTLRLRNPFADESVETTGPPARREGGCFVADLAAGEELVLHPDGECSGLEQVASQVHGSRLSPLGLR